jgi:hypothetical protein
LGTFRRRHHGLLAPTGRATRRPAEGHLLVAGRVLSRIGGGTTSGGVWGGVAVRQVNDRLRNAFPRPKEASAVKRIRDVAGRSALVTAALAVVLSGCSVLSPSTVTEPYAASDGANLNLPGSPVGLRNFLVIGAEKGEPAVVVGALINEGTSEVRVSLQADLGETATPTETIVTLGPKEIVQLGPDQEFQMEIPELPVVPGANTRLSAATTAGGRAELLVPVMRPEVEYAGITPAPTTPAPTPSATKKPKPSSTANDDTPDASETQQPTGPAADPTESPEE